MVHVLLPASISTEKAAHFLSCSPREVGMLSRKGLIKYLGNPQNNATRYVHTASLFESMADFEWMSRVRQAIYDYNLDRNDRARKRQQFQKGRASQVK